MSLVDTDEEDDRPITPPQEDCCGNSCNPCIFDIHKKLIEDWEKKKVEKLKRLPHKNCLSLTKYNKFIIKDVKEASKDYIYMLVDCGSENKDKFLSINPSQHVMIRFSNTSKPYTPINWSQSSIKLLIKLYPNGKASECIKQMKVGDDIFIRGPYGDFKYQRNSYKKILMLSIGSGIAALYPLAVSIAQDELEDTRIKIISGFRSLAHVPLKDELRQLTDYWNFECSLCLSQEETAKVTGVDIINSRLDDKVIANVLEDFTSETSLVLICGTPEFNESAENIVKVRQIPNYHVFS